MQNRHVNREKYFMEQAVTTEKYVIPLIEKTYNIDKNSSILEIGCGEGGNLTPFYKMGCKKIVGIDMSESKIKNAKKFFKKTDGNRKNLLFICNDIYNVSAEDIGQFDVVITRDVLEHIHGQEKFMNFVKKFMMPNGKFFLGFPPWQNPFGGHQQMCNNPFLSKVPYFHILPKAIYKWILSAFGESNTKIAGLLEVKETGITIEKFEKILKKEQYKIDKRLFYFINPNYEIKFGLKPRRAWRIISSIPFLRNFFITTNYYVVSKKN